MLSEMLAVRERIYKSNHPHIATTLNSLAHVAKGKGDLKLAEWRFRRAAGIYGIAYGESHHFVGVALSNAGAVLLEHNFSSSPHKSAPNTGLPVSSEEKFLERKGFPRRGATPAECSRPVFGHIGV